jgi:hypothetical protein
VFIPNEVLKTKGEKQLENYQIKDKREALAPYTGRVVNVQCKVSIKRAKTKGTKKPNVSAKIVGENPIVEGQDFGIDHVVLVDSAQDLSLFRILMKKERQKVNIKAVVVQYWTGGQPRWGLNAIAV